MASIVEMQTSRASIIAEAKEIVNRADHEKRSLTDDENAATDSMFQSADKLAGEINDAVKRDKVATMEAEMRSASSRKTPTNKAPSPAWTKASANDAMRAWTLAGTNKYHPSADTVQRHADNGFDVNADSIEYRALSVGTDTAGGFTVADEFQTSLEKILRYYWNIGEGVDSFNTSQGNDMIWPVVSDGSNAGEYVAEAQPISTNQDPVFSQVVFKSYDWYSPICKVSNQLLRDSQFDIPGLLAELFAERFAVSLDSIVMSANDGTTGPEGILHGVTSAGNLPTGNAISTANLLALEGSIPPQYLSNPGVGFVMSSATWMKSGAWKTCPGG